MGPDIVSQYPGTWTNPTAVFTHGSAMDDPLIRATSTTQQYYHQDGLGSVVAFTNPDGTVAANVRYDAWGTKLSATGTLPLYGYTGREPDETGLIYYRARYYDPSIGRFLSRDPIGMGGGINAYAYAGNSPVNFTDPLGLEPADPLATQESFMVACAPLCTGQGARAAPGSEDRWDLEIVANSPNVMPEINKAWAASNPSGSPKIERGFWVLQVDEVGKYTVQSFGTGGKDFMIPGPTPKHAIVFFHTHPNTAAEGYMPGPSPADINFANKRNLPGIIRSHDGMYYFGPKLKQ